MAGGVRTVCLALALWWIVPASAVERLLLRLPEVHNPAFSVHALELRFDAARGSAELHVERVKLGSRYWREVVLRCARARFSLDELACDKAQLWLAGRRLPFDAEFAIAPHRAAARLALRSARGARVAATFTAEAGLVATFDQLELGELVSWLRMWQPEMAKAWQERAPEGTLSGRIEWSPRRDGAHALLRLEARLEEGRFATGDGLQAAEDLGLDIRLDAQGGGSAWDWQLHLGWRQGAAYLHPLYLEAGPEFQASGRVRGSRLSVHEARAEFEGVAALALTAEIDLAEARLVEGTVAVSAADLAVLGPRWVAPLVAPASAERMRFSGHVSGGLRVQEGRLVAGDAVFTAAGLNLLGADGGSGLALGPVDGRLPWQADGESRAVLRVGGGRWGRVELGAFGLEAWIDRNGARFDRSVIPLLDGALVVDDLALHRVADGWHGRGSLVVEPISMPALTAALGLPSMSGVLSASLPGLRVTPGEIAFDGALVVSVFDGYLQATGLRLLEPFGVASHLSADIEGRHLDLAQLTETFSFGSITGFADVDVRGLELAHWRPTAFDARIASSPGRYPRRVSQRAVQNISALGGGGAVAAIQRGALGFFDTFGYRELGLRCRMLSNICSMDGIEGGGRADGGFVIMRGGGIPALNVIGYNRRVDWSELVNRLQRVVADNVTPELR
nr:hypothetical protein [Thauera aromatica]